MFGSLDGVIDDVKSDAESTGINNSVGLHDLQHRIALLEAENDGLKGLLRLEMSMVDSLRQAIMQLLEHKHGTFFTHPIPRGGNSGKILIPPCLSFPSPAILGVPEPSCNRLNPGASLTTKKYHTPRKIKILRDNSLSVG